MSGKLSQFIPTFRLILTLTIFAPFNLIGQSPPNNLSLHPDNHLMTLEGLNTSSFYDEDILESVYLEFEQSDYWQQLHDTYDTDSYVQGTLTYKGEVFENIGATFKGNTSYTKVVGGEKYSFGISLDEYVDGQDIEGYNTLNFNNAYEDPSYIKEVIYSHLNRKNIPSAKANFIKLYINGDYWGIYSNVQQLNKDFTKEWYMTNNGTLWRADAPSTEETATTPPTTGGRPGGGGAGGGGGGQWGDGTTALNYLGADTSLYQKYYTLKHSSQDNPWDLLLKVTDILNNTPDSVLIDSLSIYLDIDKTLWFLAHETAFTDDDSYIMKGRQDYYVYYEPETGLISPIEFDGNSALDTRNIAWDMFYNEENENFPLMNRLYAIPELRQRYLAHARTIIDELLDPELTDSLLNKYDALIRNAVETDPVNPYSFSEYESSLAELYDYFGNRKDILLSNSEVAKNGLTIASVMQSVNNVAFVSPEENEAADITTSISETSNVSAVYLYYSSYYVGRFTKVEMFDDGQHNDGTAGDGVYGASIPGFASGEYVRYYVEAIANDEAKTATFSPVGAEHDVYYYRVGVPETAYSDLVINEICASNESIASDNSGEYDDWIELYNNSSESISLNGYYLTDDMTELNKWAFSDVSIEGNSYLTIWADNDEDQGANHANFKLSADGEEIYLINSSGEIADQLLFAEQDKDDTWGRIPNGTGPFAQTEPTFGTENSIYIEEVSSNIISYEKLNIQLYPNPANSYITIESEDSNVVTFSLYNIQGAMVSHETISNSTTVDISHLNKGIYIVNINNSEGSFITKLLIE